MIHKIKGLYDNGSGLSIRAISKELEISRNTVRKYIAMDEATISAKLAAKSRTKWLDQHCDYLINQLNLYPELSAAKLMRRLRDKVGQVPVSERTMRRYIERLKGKVTLAQQRYYEPIVDSVAGVQCQVDLGEQREVFINGTKQTIYFCVFVLSFSRLLYVGVCLKPVDTLQLIRFHDEAFRYFGGLPEECLYDQTKLVVINERYRELELNQQFAQFATSAGFNIRVCEGYDPESKGKVEAGVKYFKQNFLYGETFESVQALRAQTLHWLDTVANMRVHGTTGQQPKDHYDRLERSKMTQYFPNDALLLEKTDMSTRKADKTGLISWKASKYSVPMKWQKARVRVQEINGVLKIYELTHKKLIAQHPISLETGKVIKNNDHYRDKTQSIKTLEEKLIRQLGSKYGFDIAALLRRNMPEYYSDQLRAAVKILDTHKPLSEELLQRLVRRENLTATRLQQHIEAWYSAKARGRTESCPSEMNEPLDLSAYQRLCHTVQGATV